MHGAAGPKAWGDLAAPQLMALSWHHGPATLAPQQSGSDEQLVTWQSSYCQTQYATVTEEIEF